MKKITIWIFSISMLLVGCQMGNNTESFSFGDDLVFIEGSNYIEIDLEKSSQRVKEKHEALTLLLSDIEVLNDIAATTTTTANVLLTAGVQVTAAPESESLNNLLTNQQYKLSSNQSIDKSKVLNVGSALSPNIEAIIELNPKLVLYSDALPDSPYISTLQNLGINIQPLAQSDYLDMFILLDVLSRVYNHKNQEINNLFKEMVDALKEIQILIDNQDGKVQPSVAILQIAEENIISNNGDSVLGRIISALGLKNVFMNNGNAGVNVEEILAANPDYIIYFTHGNAQVALDRFNDILYADDSVYRELDAVKNGNAFAISSDEFKFVASVDLDVIHVIEFLAKSFYE